MVFILNELKKFIKQTKEAMTYANTNDNSMERGNHLKFARISRYIYI